MSTRRSTNPKLIRIATPRTYALIGRIATSAAELEFVVLFCAKLADLVDEIDTEEALGSSSETIELAKKAFKGLKQSGKVPDLPNASSYFRRLKKLLNKRNAVVHGLMMNKENEGLKSYQPRKKKWVDIDDESLEKTLLEFQSMSDEMLMLRSYIWKELHPDGLIQLGLGVAAHKGIATRLG